MLQDNGGDTCTGRSSPRHTALGSLPDIAYEPPEALPLALAEPASSAWQLSSPPPPGRPLPGIPASLSLWVVNNAGNSSILSLSILEAIVCRNGGHREIFM